MNSIIEQTYLNIELIAIDDGSKDDSPLILKEYEMKYDNVNILLEGNNKGQAAARNRGISKATGKYILFVDSDDYLNINAVEKLVDIAESQEVELVRFNAKSFSDEGEAILEKEYKFDLFLKEKFIYYKNNFKNVYLSFSPSPVLYLFKKRILEINNISFKEKIIHEDELFSAELFLKANSCSFINEAFYNRRYRKGSTMTERTFKQKKYSFDSYIKIINEYENFREGLKLEKNEKFFIKYRINTLFLLLLNYQFDNEYTNKEIKKIKNNKIHYTKKFKFYIRIVKICEIIKSKLF